MDNYTKIELTTVSEAKRAEYIGSLPQTSSAAALPGGESKEPELEHNFSNIDIRPEFFIQPTDTMTELIEIKKLDGSEIVIPDRGALAVDAAPNFTTIFNDTQITSSTLVNVNERPTGSLSETKTTCNGTPTNITVTLTGKSPWTLTYIGYAGNTLTSVTTTISSTTGTDFVVGAPYTTTISVNPSVTSNYTITALTDGTGCNSDAIDLTTTALVNVNPRPTATIAGGNTICNGGSIDLSVNLTGSSPWSLTYLTTSNGTSTSTTISGISTSLYTLTVSPSKNATYSLTALTDNNTCSAEALVDINSSTIVNF
jgi:hypothetical protein